MSEHVIETIRPMQDNLIQRNTPILDAQQLVRYFDDGTNRLDVLRGASLQLHAGEMVALVGRSGSGKSTLLSLLGLLDRPQAGEIRIAGVSAEKLNEQKRASMRNKSIGFVFQHFCLLSEFDVLENVMLAGRMRGVLDWFGERKKLTERAEQLLDRVGLRDRIRQSPTTLSGGERQRVAIVRALLSNPSILLCDEPTGNLDQETSERIMSLLFELCKCQGIAALIVTHDPTIADRADRILRLEHGTLSRSTTTGLIAKD